MFERPSMSRSLPRSRSSSFVEPSTSTPPYVLLGRSRASRPPFAACGSDGPRSSFSSQWSPRFSAMCLTADHAVRCARSSESYCSWALSSVSSYVFRTFPGERFSVPGSSSLSTGIGAPPRSGVFRGPPRDGRLGKRGPRSGGRRRRHGHHGGGGRLPQRAVAQAGAADPALGDVLDQRGLGRLGV